MVFIGGHAAIYPLTTRDLFDTSVQIEGDIRFGGGDVHLHGIHDCHSLNLQHHTFVSHCHGSESLSHSKDK